MAEEEKVKIKVEVDGSAEAAKEFDQMTDAMTRSVRTQKLINDTEKDLQRKVQIEALKSQAREVNNVSSAFRALQSSAAPANDVLQKVGFQFNSLKGSIGATTGLVGNLGGKLASVVPELAGFQSAIQAGGQAMGQFLGVLGGGAGLAAGGIVAAVTLLVTWFAKSAEETDKLAEATKKNAEELKAYIETIENLRDKVSDRFSKVGAGRAYEKDFESGALSSEQYGVERQTAKELYAQRGDIDSKLRDAYARGDRDAVEKLAKLSQQANSAPYRAERAREFQGAARDREAGAAANASALKQMGYAAESADADKEFRDLNVKRETDEANARGKRLDEARELTDALMRKEEELSQHISDLNKYQIEQDLKFRFDAIQKEADAKQVARDAETEAIKLQRAEEKKIDEEAHDAMRARNKAFTDTASAMGQIGASTTLKAFSELAKGHKLAIGAVLEGIGDQMVAEGTRVLFQAAAMAFFPPTAPFAGGLAAVGAAEIAAGIGLGAAGARGEGGSSSGGGGKAGGKGGGDTNYADPFGDTARYGAGQSGGGPTVINVTMPTVISPSPEDGLRIREAVRQANNVYGR